MTEHQYNKYLVYAYAVSKSYDLAKDLVHQGWIAAADHDRQNDPSYIAGCIRNQWRDRCRDREIENRNNKSVSDQWHLKLNDTHRRIQELDILKVYDLLTPEQKSTMDAMWYEENCSEVARQKGLPRKTVNERVLKVREIFQKMYRDNILVETPSSTREKYKAVAPIAITCLNNGKTYKNMKEASKDLKLTYSNIRRAVDLQVATKGYRFKKVN